MARQGSVTIHRQVRSVRRAMGQLVKALEGLLPLLRTAGEPAPGRARRRLELSPARRAALRLHGAYLAHVRKLRVRDKARVRLVYRQKGVAAAIATAKRLAR